MELITGEARENVLYLYAHGKIDSTNADQAEKEINALREKQPYDALVIDADDLSYISSAGLRVLLRLRKAEKDMKVINASSEIYEIFEITGFSEMIPIEKAYRKLSVDGCEIIGKGAKGTVYRWNPDTIVKVYHNPDSLPDIQRERELARRAFVLGIPTAIPYDVVLVDGKFGSVFELLNAESFSALIAKNPEKVGEYTHLYADLLKQIHSTQVKAEDMPDVKGLIYKWIDAVVPYLDADVIARVRALVDAVPDTMNMLHCDYHTNNIMMQNGETLLIDMDTLAHGHPIFELANVYITYVGFGHVDPSNVESFLGIPYELAVKVWELFLPDYLGTDDPAMLRAVEDKVKLLSHIRLLRHTVRRSPDGELAAKAIEFCGREIPALLEKIDTLEF